MKNRTNEAIWIESQQRWSIKVQRDGQRRQFTSSKKGRKGKVEAERKADEWLEAGEIKDMRFGVAWKRFVAAKERECGTAWVKQIESLGESWLKPTLEHKYISKITQNDWKNAILSAYEAGKSRKTCMNIRGVITTFRTYCEDEGIEIGHIKKLSIPKDAPVGERKILQPEDIKRLFAEDSIMHYGKPKKCWYIHAWRLMVALGLRRGEVCGLRNEDIQGGILTVRRSVNSLGEVTQGKTKAAQRRMAIPAHAQAILDAQAAQLKAAGIISPWVFPADDGSMADSNKVYGTWDTYRTQHGIKSSLHELRHTHISLMQNAVPEAMLKRMVGHTKNMDTLGTYGHEVDGEAAKAAALVDGVFDELL